MKIAGKERKKEVRQQQPSQIYGSVTYVSCVRRELTLTRESEITRVQSRYMSRYIYVFYLTWIKTKIMAFECPNER